MRHAMAGLKFKGVTLTAEQFERLVRAHETFARGLPGGARAIPRMVIARKMDCVQRNLADVDFTGADLADTRFIGTDLSRAALYCANLAGCDFRAAILFRADLRGANFAGCKLAGANLDEADMRSAVLAVHDDLAGLKWIGTSLKGARLDGADLSEAVALEVDFTNCAMRGAKLRFANLKNANFSGAILDGADLAGARLEGARFNGAVMTGIDVSRLNIPTSALKGCVLDPTPEAEARLPLILATIDSLERWVRTEGREGEPARLDGLDLRPASAHLKDRMLPGLSARNALAYRVDFSGAQLSGANFAGADLRKADFTGADLRGASFRGANLAHARFRDANLRPLQLRSGLRPVDLEDACLDGTGLTPPQSRTIDLEAV